MRLQRTFKRMQVEANIGKEIMSARFSGKSVLAVREPGALGRALSLAFLQYVGAQTQPRKGGSTGRPVIETAFRLRASAPGASWSHAERRWGPWRFLQRSGGANSTVERLVDLVGIEPTTSSMPWKRAPSCATGPLRRVDLLSPTTQA
jgi:hypothetical protein